MRFATAIMIAFAALGTAPSTAAVDPKGAAEVFAEAKAICAADGGRFWGRSLCGPTVLVDYTDLGALANSPDPAGVLKPQGDVWVGKLPGDVLVSNTAIVWEGKRWTELLWPLEPKGLTTHAGWRRVMLAHEMFHRIQEELRLTRPEAANAHLDTLEGRYLIQLEWRALAAALKAPTVAKRRTAIADALLFARERYRRFPGSGEEERNLQYAEGLAEYTGVRVGLTTPAARVDYALFDLQSFAAMPSLVRSFAYAEGPAYGLLLDRADPKWRGKLGTDRRFDERLGDALHLTPTGDLKARAKVYDADGKLRASEEQREQAKLARIAAYKAKFVDGPVLVLPLHHSSYQFNPATMVPIGVGTVFPTIKLNAEWGSLTVEGDALLDDRKTRAAVSAVAIDVAHAKGQGWTLDLKPGWTIVPGEQAGDYTLRAPAK